MDYKELVETLQKESEWYGVTDENAGVLMEQAATAITELLEEVERVKAERDSARHNLRTVQKMVKEYQEEIIPGFREMAEKAEGERDAYKIFFDDVSSKPDCNTCASKQCEYRPRIAETTRFNCPLWSGKKEG